MAHKMTMYWDGDGHCMVWHGIKTMLKWKWSYSNTHIRARYQITFIISLVVLSVITLKLLPTYFFAHLTLFCICSGAVALHGNNENERNKTTKEKKAHIVKWTNERMRRRRRRREKAALQYCYKIKWHHFLSASGEIVSFLSQIACMVQSIVIFPFFFSVVFASSCV